MRTFLTSSMILSLLVVPACGGSGGGTATDSGTETTTGTATETTAEITTTGVTTTATTAEPTTSTTATPTTTEPGTTTTTTTEPGTTTTTEPGTTTSTTSDTDTTTTGTTGTDTDTDTDTDTTDTSTTGDPAMCPPAPNDSECDTCVKANCCDEVLACVGDEDCACFFGCINMGGSNQMCAGQCMVNPAQIPELAAVGQCVNGSCGQQCM